MRRGFRTLLFVFIFITLCWSLGTRYLWNHKLATTTAAIDCTFTVKWQQVTIYSDTLDIWYRAGAPDTSSWSSRDWMKLEAGSGLKYENPVYLKRFEYKTVSGTGYIYLMGTKKSAQY